MRSTNFGGMNRRNFLKAAAATGITGGLAGCADNTEPEPEPTNKTNETEDTTQQKEDQGLNIDFTWNDILQAEQEHYHSTTGSSRGLEVADKTRIEDANLLDYDEFQEVLLTTVNEIVHDFGEGRDQDSSTAQSRASAAVNIILNDVLEDNETYQEEDLQIKMMPLTNDGHGYTQVASTHHPLTTVDSNEPIAGPTQEAPLERRNTQDPIANFTDQDFEDVDELRRSTYHGFPSDIYSKGTESSRHIGFNTSVIDDYYDNAIFSGDREGRELWMGPVREAVGTIRTLWDQDFFDEDYIAISSSPSNLPSIENHETFSLYAQDLVENHTDKYNETDEMREAILEP